MVFEPSGLCGPAADRVFRQLLARSTLPRGPARDSLALSVRQRVCVAVRRQAAQALRRRLPDRGPAPPSAGPSTELAPASAAALEAELAVRTCQGPPHTMAPPPCVQPGVPVIPTVPIAATVATEAAAGVPAPAALAARMPTRAAGRGAGLGPPFTAPSAPAGFSLPPGPPLAAASWAPGPQLATAPLVLAPPPPLPGPWATPLPHHTPDIPCSGLAYSTELCTMHSWQLPSAGEGFGRGTAGPGQGVLLAPPHSLHALPTGVAGEVIVAHLVAASPPPPPSPPPIPPPPPSPGETTSPAIHAEPSVFLPAPGGALPHGHAAWLPPTPLVPEQTAPLAPGETHSPYPPSNPPSLHSSDISV